MNEGSGAAGVWGMMYCRYYDVHLFFIISLPLPPAFPPCLSEVRDHVLLFLLSVPGPGT